MDWSATALGPCDSWPQSLRTAVGLCLASNFPISLAWGPQRVQIYNDGYWPICGGKHPRSMGQDFKECWASPWPVIGAAFERALAGETCYLENRQMFLDRNGYLEETFFTFSFSPIRDESGQVGGLFHPVTETTAKMLSERRARTLRELSSRTVKATTTEEALLLSVATLEEFKLDIPFALCYLIDAKDGRESPIARTAGVAAADAVAGVNTDQSISQKWQLGEVARTNTTVQIDALRTRFPELSCGPYPEAPDTALAMPITPPGCEQPLAVLIVGVSCRLPLSDEYRTFCHLIAATVTSTVANARAYEEARRRAEALAEIDRAKTTFFSNVSHEFRTPLTLMLGPLEDELAESVSPLPALRRERLGTAYRNTLRLLKLVNTLLDFSRLEAGRTQANYQATDLAMYTTELASVFRSAMEKAGLTLSVDCQPPAEPAYVDRDMWEKIVLNLLSNALKHTFVGGVTVTLASRGEFTELSVSDSGVGIARAELPHLFDRFHRVKHAKSRTHEGTGIGLALVRELTRAHGGDVRVDSIEGEGSTFTVSIKTRHGLLPSGRVGTRPAEPEMGVRVAAYVEEAMQWMAETPGSFSGAHSAPSDTSSHTTVQQKPDSFEGPRPRILWADDNADMRDYVRRLLADRYDVIAVPNGDAAVAAALQERPDLVLTDAMMPGLDGFGVLRELRSHERTRTVPVILLSARAGEESAVEGLNAGADDYLVKPFSARELLARVGTHVEMGRMRREWEAELETRVGERTAELARTTRALAAENTERERAGLRLQSQLERMSLLDQITRAVAGHQDLDSIFQVVIRSIEDNLRVELCAMCLHEPASGQLLVNNLGVHRGPLIGPDEAGAQSRIDIGANGLYCCVLGELVYEPDSTCLQSPFATLLAASGYHSFVFAPLHVENRLFGTLLAARVQSAGFTNDECEFLRQLSGHIALAARQAQLHAHLRKAYEELRQTQLAAMQQERLRALGQMASGVAHNINNAISPAMAYVETLLAHEPGLSERARNYLNMIRRAVDDATATVARLREFYRQREPELRTTALDLNALIDDVVELTRARWSDMPQLQGVVIELTKELSSGLGSVRGVESDIRESLTNLVFNAVDAMPDGGRLTLRTSLLPEGERVCLEVSDTGIGMDEATRARCLEPFFTTKGERGTGLGLAMVFGMAERHGAEIEIDSTPGRGTTIRLIYVVSPAPAIQVPMEYAAPSTIRHRILLIDDDPLVLKSIATLLENEGHTVLMASEAEAGIDAFLTSVKEGRPFPVVVTDLGMPHIDGQQVARAVKTASPRAVVILLTGWGQAFATDERLPENVDCVLSKPPTLAELRAAFALTAPQLVPGH